MKKSKGEFDDFIKFGTMTRREKIILKSGLIFGGILGFSLCFIIVGII